MTLINIFSCLVFFQVFHCVHFECPSLTTTFGDESSLKSADKDGGAQAKSPGSTSSTHSKSSSGSSSLSDNEETDGATARAGKEGAANGAKRRVPVRRSPQQHDHLAFAFPGGQVRADLVDLDLVPAQGAGAVVNARFLDGDHFQLPPAFDPDPSVQPSEQEDGQHESLMRPIRRK